MSISGHRTRSAFDRYYIVPEGDLKEAVKELKESQRVGKGRVALGPLDKFMTKG